MEIINHLINQYKSSTGIKNIDINLPQFLSEFNEWVKERNEIISLYIGLLDHMNIKFKKSSCVEVGKTSMDSIVIPYETTIITPYSEGFEDLKKKIIEADVKVYDTMPTLVKDNKFLGNLYNDSFSTYMTQNPYNNECLENWERLHNSGKNEIIVGVFGYQYENDTTKKINQLKYLKQQLNGNYIEDFTTYKDQYCYAIASEEKVKINVKRKYFTK